MITIQGGYSSDPEPVSNATAPDPLRFHGGFAYDVRHASNSEAIQQSHPNCPYLVMLSTRPIVLETRAIAMVGFDRHGEPDAWEALLQNEFGRQDPIRLGTGHPPWGHMRLSAAMRLGARGGAVWLHELGQRLADQLIQYFERTHFDLVWRLWSDWVARHPEFSVPPRGSDPSGAEQ